jgi:magnesium-transporting ATPase (P-type)
LPRRSAPSGRWNDSRSSSRPMPMCSARSVPASEVVWGDVVDVRAGDQVVADGEFGTAVDLRLDESILTGEPESVPRAPDISFDTAHSWWRAPGPTASPRSARQATPGACSARPARRLSPRSRRGAVVTTRETRVQ